MNSMEVGVKATSSHPMTVLHRIHQRYFLRGSRGQLSLAYTFFQLRRGRNWIDFWIQSLLVEKERDIFVDA